MTLLLVDAAGRPLTATWQNADGTTTRVEEGDARIEAPSYEVEFREVATGEAVRVTLNRPWGEGSEYHWTEGNMGCDCNRAMEFWRARHTDAALEDEPDVPCSDGKYRVTIRINGKVVLEDYSALVLEWRWEEVHEHEHHYWRYDDSPGRTWALQPQRSAPGIRRRGSAQACRVSPYWPNAGTD